MSDSKNKPADEAPSEAEGPLGGERLASARRELQISVAEIAKELHLDEPKVHALERNDFDILGAAVFAKGHLRKYAQLVKVDDKDVMADYYQLTRAASVPPLLTTHRRARREMTPGPWIAVIVVIIVVATAYWWFTSRPVSVAPALLDAVPEETSPIDEPLESAAPDREAPEAETSAPAAVQPPEQSEIADDDSSVLESATTATIDAATEQAPATAGDAAPPPDLGDGQMRMLLSYSGDCWTEISDARGRRLFFGLGKDGRSVELSGEAPFNVLLGNADSVSIRVNGIERIIAAGERRGRTARLTISGP